MSGEDVLVAISPCPNDTFVFGPLALGWIRPSFKVRFLYEDIETLNEMAIAGAAPIVKASFAVLKEIFRNYRLLPIGAAFGVEHGPVLVGTSPYDPSEVPNLRVLVPGRHTTANLLFSLRFKEVRKKSFVLYHEVIPRLLSGEAELGVLIHEERFVFKEKGLYEVLDLGRWWREETGYPIPLGGIFARTDLSDDVVAEFVAAVKSSMKLARERFEELYPFIKEKAQALSKDIIVRHISAYVTELTEDLGKEGRSAVEALAKRIGIEAIEFF